MVTVASTIGSQSAVMKVSQTMYYNNPCPAVNQKEPVTRDYPVLRFSEITRGKETRTGVKSVTRQALPSIPPTACTKISSFVCPFRAIIILAPDFTSSCPSQLLQLVAAACFKNWVSHLVRKLAPAWFEELVVGRKCIKGYHVVILLLLNYFCHSLVRWLLKLKELRNKITASFPEALGHSLRASPGQHSHPDKGRAP
ncbi:hypothetical protein RRG08_040091 [Elysia crispata]|uniref:Uncharacterized protein n=1 Tax=Elysia crispata TaxID=231223 RepID=A0AAE0XVW7_9GAST|nr:hypothetical protein RRG08_040091 [Elysia crispata]